MTTSHRRSTLPSRDCRTVSRSRRSCSGRRATRCRSASRTRGTTRPKEHAMPAITVSAVTTGTDTLTATSHGLTTGDRFRLRNVGGALPAATPALAAVTDYFAVVTGVDTLKLSDTNAHALAGTNIFDLTGTGSGTTTIEYGLPYCIPNEVAVDGVSQVHAKDLNGVWGALVALYALL